MNEFLLVFLIFMTVHRTTRLLVTDAFPPIERVRDGIANRWGDDSWQEYLSTCPWCMSIYISVVVVWLCCATLRNGVPVPVLVAAASSTFTGLVAQLESD